MRPGQPGLARVAGVLGTMPKVVESISIDGSNIASMHQERRSDVLMVRKRIGW
jgi:hypothetical protein